MGHERVLTESLIPLADVGALIPGRHSSSAVARWTRSGARGVVLESVLVGGRVMTSREAIGRFLAALNTTRRGKSAALAAAG
jgi:hypothetical protein